MITGELVALTRRCASGALRVRGDPGGIIYLSRGRLAFAESAVVPDLGSRLVNSRRLLQDQWSRADQDAGPGGWAGAVLVRRGLIDAAEWQALLRSEALDALVVLAVQLAAGPPEAGTWFAPGQGGWPVSLGLEAGPAWAYAKQEAERLAGNAVVPDARPRLRGPGPALSARAAAVLAQCDGRATVRELAWRNGLALYAVMDWIDRLIDDGVCALGGQPDPARSLAPGQGQDRPGPPRPPGSGAPGSGAAMPHNRLGAGMRWTPPDPEVLGRVLAALRRLG